MTPEDFSQFDDPRIREVMAAAANLVELLAPHQPYAHASLSGVWLATNTLTAALFAAQHSRPKCQYYQDSTCSEHCATNACRPAQHSKPETDGHQPALANFCGKCGHITWLVHLKDGKCLDCRAAEEDRPKKESLFDIPKEDEEAFFDSVLDNSNDDPY